MVYLLGIESYAKINKTIVLFNVFLNIKMNQVKN